MIPTHRAEQQVADRGHAATEVVLSQADAKQGISARHAASSVQTLPKSCWFWGENGRKPLHQEATPPHAVT